jgi:hypothetical protein
LLPFTRLVWQLTRQSGSHRTLSRPNKQINVTLHMVSSVDGFIAKHDNSVSWLAQESMRLAAAQEHHALS